jgi:hypothetical protein
MPSSASISLKLLYEPPLKDKTLLKIIRSQFCRILGRHGDTTKETEKHGLPLEKGTVATA